MSNKQNGTAWYERIGFLTAIGVAVGIVFGLGRNDLLFGIVMGFFLGAGVPLGAVGSRWYRARSDGEGNPIVMALLFAVAAGIIIALLTAAISGLLDSVNEIVKGILNIALDSGSSIVWGIAIGIGTAVGAGLRAVLGKKE